MKVIRYYNLITSRVHHIAPVKNKFNFLSVFLVYARTDRQTDRQTHARTHGQTINNTWFVAGNNIRASVGSKFATSETSRSQNAEHTVNPKD